MNTELLTNLFTLDAVQTFGTDPDLPKNIAVLNPHAILPTRIIKDLDSDFFYINDPESSVIMQLDREAIDVFIAYAQAGCPRDYIVPPNPETPNKDSFFASFSANPPDGVTTVRLDNNASNYILSAMHKDDCPHIMFIVSDQHPHHVPFMMEGILTVHTFLTTPMQLPLQPIRHEQD